MNLILANGQPLRGDLLLYAVLRNDLAPVPQTLEADIRHDDALARHFAEGQTITAGGAAHRIIKTERVREPGTQGPRLKATLRVTAVLDSCHALCFVRERAVIKSQATLAGIYRACGGTVPVIEGDFEVPRFVCPIGGVPTYGIAKLLQEQGGAMSFRRQKLRFVRLQNLMSQSPAATLPPNSAEEIASGFLQRHEVPRFFSVDETGAIVQGNDSKARHARYVPKQNVQGLRNMTRALVRTCSVTTGYNPNLWAGDTIQLADGRVLVIGTIAHIQRGATSSSRLWLYTVKQ